MAFGKRLSICASTTAAALLAGAIGFSSRGLASEWPHSITATRYAEGTWLPYAPSGGTQLLESSYQGHTTVLEVKQTLAKVPRHDVDFGRTELVLRARKNNRVILHEVFNEVWECLGFEASSRKYVIISKNEHGIKVTLRGLIYLDEQLTTFQDSVFDRVGFEATASLRSPQCNYLALIGAPRGKKTYELYVLNLRTDRLQRLGPAPAPPPLTAAQRKIPQAEQWMGSWEAPERHYAILDSSTWKFITPEILLVNYKKNAPKARNRDRRLRQWNLRTVF